MTKFRDGFMMKSPLPKHDAIMAEMKAKSKESSGRDDAPDFSNAEVAELKKDYDKAKAEHDSAAKMSPFQGYVDGEERASHYQPTADLYQNVFNALQSGADKIAAASTPENMAKKKAMKAQRLEKRIDKRNQKADDKGMGGQQIADVSKALTGISVDPIETKRDKFDEKTAKLKKRQAEAIVDQTEFENIVNKNKNNQFDKLTSIMSKEDKEKYGLT